MDLKHPTTKIPNHESEPPPPPPPHSQSIKLLTYPNGKPHHHHPPPYAAAAYRECLKNHAVGIGGHALDGCGEFMPSPTSFKCAACGCHRNFHRRESTTDFHRHHQPSTSASLSPPSPPPEPTNYVYGHHLALSLGTVATPGTPAAVKINGRKRFRTKFSQDQKQKMLSFAEKVGWKMPRSDDKIVTDFCNEIGIKRRIFKVWMHNNKNTSTKREKDTATAATTAGVAASLDSHHQENGSSSSS